jgi:hypothetical protein
MPLGSGAQYSNQACDSDVEADAGGPPYINTKQWSIPIYRASRSDPSVSIYVNGTRWGAAKIPPLAQPSNDADRHLSLIDPMQHHVIDMYAASTALWPIRITAGTLGEFDLYGDGVTPMSGAGYTYSGRAYGGSAIGGLVRTWELQAGQIRHALAFAIPQTQMKKGPVWPATSEDVDTSRYVGNVPMGSLVAIPSGVDVNALGLSAVGLQLAHALQLYGAYLVDSGDDFALFAEPGAASLVNHPGLGSDEATLRSVLRCVSNNGPSSVGGGGTPLAPLAPPLG